MEKKDIIEQLNQKEELLKKTEMVFHQIVGQLSLLREMLKKENEEVKKE